jgi:DNA-binding NarL/FixJ family response regulator
MTMLEGLATALQRHWQDATILTATNGEAGLRLFFDQDPNLIILGMQLPDQSGVDLLRQIRRVSDTPIVVQAARVDDNDQVRALGLGADEYVVKPCSFLVMIARIKALLRRAVVRPRDEVPAGALTRRQQEIVGLVTEGLTNQEIADRLGLKRSTIANHVDQIMQRLDMTRRIQLAIWAARQGPAHRTPAPADRH